jgi:hypothetical protein
MSLSKDATCIVGIPSSFAVVVVVVIRLASAFRVEIVNRRRAGIQSVRSATEFRGSQMSEPDLSRWKLSKRRYHNHTVVAFVLAEGSSLKESSAISTTKETKDEEDDI